MSDDLVKRARAQMAKGEEHIKSIGGEVTQQGLMPLLCDRIEGLEELLWAAEKDANEAEAYAAQVEKDAKRADAIWSDNYEALKAKLDRALYALDKALLLGSFYGMEDEHIKLWNIYHELTGGKDD